jgi:hypothetical protein
VSVAEQNGDAELTNGHAEMNGHGETNGELIED